MSILLGGLGALVGPLIGSRWAGRSDHRLHARILVGYLVIATGYVSLGISRTVWLAAGCAMLAHAGGSIVWVFSTTLLQLHTEDRFRGRVFAADLGLGSLTFAVTAYLCGLVMDWGVSARAVASWTGLLMLIPAGLFAWATRRTEKERAMNV
jgi:MFS family permease